MNNAPVSPVNEVANFPVLFQFIVFFNSLFLFYKQLLSSEHCSGGDLIRNDSSMRASNYRQNSMTCGYGKKQRAQACFDNITGVMLDISACGVSNVFQTEDCSVSQFNSVFLLESL